MGARKGPMTHEPDRYSQVYERLAELGTALTQHPDLDRLIAALRGYEQLVEDIQTDDPEAGFILANSRVWPHLAAVAEEIQKVKEQRHGNT